MTALRDVNALPAVMIDFSHANSKKRPELQLEVCADVCQQVAIGNRHIIGMMVESHLLGGRQDLSPEEPLTYGQSITDACIGWEDTMRLLDDLAQSAFDRRASSVD